MSDVEALLRRGYRAFNARDIDAALEIMHPDVDWPNAMEGTRVHGHAEVRAYWTRQFDLIDSCVEPHRFTIDVNERVLVDAHQVVRDMVGSVVADRWVRHVYTIRDGLVARMDVKDSEEPPG